MVVDLQPMIELFCCINHTLFELHTLDQLNPVTLVGFTWHHLVIHDDIIVGDVALGMEVDHSSYLISHQGEFLEVSGEQAVGVLLEVEVLKDTPSHTEPLVSTCPPS